VHAAVRAIGGATPASFDAPALTTAAVERASRPPSTRSRTARTIRPRQQRRFIDQAFAARGPPVAIRRGVAEEVAQWGAEGEADPLDEGRRERKPYDVEVGARDDRQAQRAGHALPVRLPSAASPNTVLSSCSNWRGRAHLAAEAVQVFDAEVALIRVLRSTTRWHAQKPVGSAERSSSTNRLADSSLPSTDRIAPSAISSADSRPAAGACITPVPEKPSAANNPSANWSMITMAAAGHHGLDAVDRDRRRSRVAVGVADAASRD